MKKDYEQKRILLSNKRRKLPGADDTAPTAPAQDFRDSCPFANNSATSFPSSSDKILKSGV
jgi:hypothetical protein